MKTNVALVVIISVVAVTFIGWEIAAQARILLLMFLASAVSALIYSMMHRPEGIVASDYPGQDVIEATGPGGIGARMKGKNLPERLLGDRTVILVLIVALAWFMWWHHTTTEKLLKENTEAIDRLTYVTLLSPEEKAALKLNMPESLRRLLRRVDP